MPGSGCVSGPVTLGVKASMSSVAARLDARAIAKRIGLVVLATDHTTESDFARLMQGRDVGVYVNRIPYENPTTHESLQRTGPLLAAAVADILPDEPLDVLVYGCTAASVVLGNDQVAVAMNSAKPDTPCVTPSSAALDAFAALGVTKISLLAPYTQDVTDTLVRYFSEHGPEVINATCLDLSDDRDMARLSKDSIIEAAVAACDAGSDAVFISCTALRALDCAAQIEARLGKPVITSNQAMIWRCMRHLAIADNVPSGGTLFTR